MNCQLIKWIEPVVMIDNIALTQFDVITDLMAIYKDKEARAST